VECSLEGTPQGVQAEIGHRPVVLVTLLVMMVLMRVLMGVLTVLVTVLVSLLMLLASRNYICLQQK
jgi:hypothetical protein